VACGAGLATRQSPALRVPTDCFPSRDARGEARRATRSRAYPSRESSYRAVVPSPDGVFARDMRSGEHLAPFTLAGAHALTTTPSAS
jgi:hypothetical protein